MLAVVLLLIGPGRLGLGGAGDGARPPLRAGVWFWGWISGSAAAGGPTEQVTPSAIPGLSAVRAVAAGGEHALALRDDGTVWAWGQNLRGQLGAHAGAGTVAP